MRLLWKTVEERDKKDEFSEEGTRMSAGNLFHRKGTVKVKDLLVIRGEEGLDGRLINQSINQSFYFRQKVHRTDRQ